MFLFIKRFWALKVFKIPRKSRENHASKIDKWSKGRYRYTPQCERENVSCDHALLVKGGADRSNSREFIPDVRISGYQLGLRVLLFERRTYAEYEHNFHFCIAIRMRRSYSSYKYIYDGCANPQQKLYLFSDLIRSFCDFLVERVTIVQGVRTLRLNGSGAAKVCSHWFESFIRVFVYGIFYFIAALKYLQEIINFSLFNIIY